MHVKEKNKEKKLKENLANLISGIIKTVGLSTAVDRDVITWWANLSTASFVICIALQTVALLTADDSERLFECFSVLSFCLMGLVKLFSLRVYRKQWLQVLNQMVTLENKHIGLKQVPEEEYESDDETLDLTTFVHDYTTQFESTSTFLSRVYKSTAVGFIVTPFIEYTYMKFIGDSPDYPHILPCWVPLDQVHGSGYMVSIVLEFVSAIYCVAVHLAFDRSSAGVLMFVKGQYLLLRQYTENIAGKGHKCKINEIRDKRALYRIKYSHQSSIILINTVGEIGKLLQNIMGFYYFVITLTLGTVAMRLKMEVLSTTELLSLLQYLGATLTQLFLFCYYGDAVSEASTMLLGQGPSGSAYWCISPRVRRGLALLAIGTTIPRRLRAGPFHFLDLPSFTMIVRAAYSYYALLGK